MSNMPERIWLTEIEDEGIDWCEDKINEGDTEYVRADLHEAEIARLREAGREMYNALKKSSGPLSRVFAPFAWLEVDPDANP